MTYANKTLRNEYMSKAQDIGSNAINLVKEFFDTQLGVVDSIDYQMHEWTLTDLDRALDEIGGNKRSADEVEIKTVDRLHQYRERKLKYINGLGFSFQRVFRYLLSRRFKVGVMLQIEMFEGNKTYNELKDEAADLLSRIRSVFYGVDSK